MQRQREKEKVDPLLRQASVSSSCSRQRKSRNHRVLAAFFAYFLWLLTKSMPSETKRKNCWEKYATGGASAIRNTVVSAGFQPLWGVKTGTLPRNRLAFSATGGASAIRNTVVSAGFQPPWVVKTGTLPRNRLAFSATGGASAIILAFSRRCAILNPSHIQRQSRDLRVAPMGA